MCLSGTNAINELNPIVQRDTFSRSYDAFKDGARWESGSARVAINEWLAQYSIKMKQIEVRSGIETKINIIPKLRAASIDIKQLDPWDRECFFQDEVEACKSKGCKECISTFCDNCITFPRKRVFSSTTGRKGAFLNAD